MGSATPTISRDVESILHGHPYRAIIRLAWPATASMLLHTVFSVVDAIWVGHLGADPIAAVISATFIVWILQSLVMVISTGLVAMVSQALGAGDKKAAQSVGEYSLRFAVLFALLITVVGLLLRQPLFALMHLEPSVVTLGKQYMAVYFLAAILIVFVEWSMGLFRASGDTRRPLAAMSTGIVLNVILDPLLIYGIGPLPRLGVVGAALATAISYTVVCLIFLRFLRAGRLPFPVRLSPWGTIDWSIVGRMVTIGIPISISNIVFSIVYLFVNRITAGFGTAAVATLGIGNRIESINYLFAYGFSIAAATLVGQNLGAGNPARAAALTRKTLVIVSIYTLLTSIVFMLFPRTIMHVFVDDPQLLQAGSHYIRILALSQVFMAWEIVLEGAFSGAGDTMPPMIVAIPGAVLRIPSAWVLGVWLGLGPDGVWWTITTTTVVKGVALYVWFSLGRWRKRRVL
ncbi:MAG: MATE family efflux transporter [Candidatus Zixiibacteriota bacterium]